MWRFANAVKKIQCPPQHLPLNTRTRPWTLILSLMWIFITSPSVSGLPIQEMSLENLPVDILTVLSGCSHTPPFTSCCSECSVCSRVHHLNAVSVFMLWHKIKFSCRFSDIVTELLFLFLVKQNDDSLAVYLPVV